MGISKTTSHSIFNVTDWAIGGVDSSLAGNGGPECANFLSTRRKILETLLACLLSVIYIYIGYSRITFPPVPTKVLREDRGGKRTLLILMCLVYGMEFGFKFASRTVIYILNPCHIVTALQIALLAVPPTSAWVTVVYRIQIHCLQGTLLALIFPVLNTRLLPFETALFYVQHSMMFVIPFYLMRTGISGAYTVEETNDFSWGFLTAGIQILYHFVILQGLGLISEVNLNSMLCPAVSDPLHGPNYRLWALGHQSILILFTGKMYTIICLVILQCVGAIKRRGDKYVTLVPRRPQICEECSTQKKNCIESSGKLDENHLKED